jgi:hypothetical protein
MANTALTNAPASSAAAIVAELRAALRGLTSYEVQLRMSMRVWLALVSWHMHPEAEERQTTDLEPVLTPNEFCARISAPGLGRIGTVWLDAACDWDGYSVTGWPVDEYLENDDNLCVLRNDRRLTYKIRNSTKTRPLRWVFAF